MARLYMIIIIIIILHCNQFFSLSGSAPVSARPLARLYPMMDCNSVLYDHGVAIEILDFPHSVLDGGVGRHETR